MYSLESLKENYQDGNDSVLGTIEKVVQQVRNFSHLNAIITDSFDYALKRAAFLDGMPKKERDLLPLFGVPVTVKDNILTKGIRTTAASKMLADFIPPYSATVVERLEAAGAVIIGKTNMDEFAMGASSESSAFGVTRNPWNLDYVPGGSSGGSAAAVAADLCSFSLGTDTGGSIRQPASFCGISGIKPTYGRVSRYGVIAYASSLDQVGVLGKSVADLEVALNIISGYDAKDATSSTREVNSLSAEICAGEAGSEPLRGLRIGRPKEYLTAGLDDQVRSVYERVVGELENLGATFVDITLPHTPLAVPTYYILAPAEASSNLARYDGVHFGYRSANPANLDRLYKESRSQGFGAEVQRRIMIGSYVLSSGYYDAYYRKAQQVRSLIRADFEQVFSQYCDLILTPTSPTPPFKIGEKMDDPLKMYLCDVCTSPVNLAGLPGLVFPAGVSQNPELPIGMQLIGPDWSENVLCSTGKIYQSVTKWHQRSLT